MKYRYAVENDAFSFPKIEYDAIEKLTNNMYSPDIVKRWMPNLEKNALAQSIEREKNNILNPNVLTMVAEEKGNVVCFCSLMLEKGYLWRLYINPEYAGKHIASELLKKVEEIAKEKGITKIKLDASLNAEGFYLKQGYTTIVKWEKKMKGDWTITCIRMEKDL